jgi:accessory gene regulator protein AgrB
VKLSSGKRIDRFITVIIMSIGLTMLIAPMWILQALDDPRKKLAVITAFIVVFLGMVSYATVAKLPEILAATAA